MNNYSVIEKKNELINVSTAIIDIFKLPLNRIEFIKGDQVYGSCSINGVITLKLEYSDGELIPEMEVWRTLAHELAHLKYHNHGDDFWFFNRDILNEVSKLIGRRIRPEVAFTRKGVVY